MCGSGACHAARRRRPVKGKARGRWEWLLRGEGEGPWERLAEMGLWGLSVLYGAALRGHLAGYRCGLAKRTRLPATVISIGNLTLGGTGKTTATVATAKWLAERGRRVAVLSRGYRGAGEKGGVVVSEGFGPLVGPGDAGDEPYLMAKELPGVFVLAGKDRRRTGRRAVEEFGAQVVVLDDGFQYQRLVKDVEVALVDALEPFGYDFLVPRGRLREPVRHLARADAVWITHSDLVRQKDLAQVKRRVTEVARSARVWEAVHAPVRLRRLDEEGEAQPDAMRGRRVFALSSVGNPAAFERTVQRLGAVLVGRARFPDHHEYRVEELREVARGEGALVEWILTTAKDAVRLPEEAFDRPAWCLEVELAGREGRATLSEELSCLLEENEKT